MTQYGHPTRTPGRTRRWLTQSPQLPSAPLNTLLSLYSFHSTEVWIIVCERSWQTCYFSPLPLNGSFSTTLTPEMLWVTALRTVSNAVELTFSAAFNAPWAAAEAASSALT